MRVAHVLLALVGAALSGCALIAGYDFGKYSEATGGQGAGGASSTSSSSTSSSSSSTSSSSTSSSSTSTSSSGMGSSSSSGTTSSGGDAGSAMILASNLTGPEGVVVDTGTVYFSTSNPGTPKTNDLWTLSIGGQTPNIALPDLDAVSAMALGGNDMGAYAAVTQGDAGAVYSIGISGPGIASLLGSEPAPEVILGVAVSGHTVYYAAGAAGALDLEQNLGGASMTVVSGAMATGPLATDAVGLYWATAGTMERAGLDGTGEKTLAQVTSTVNAIATDMVGFVYWTEKNGNVLRVETSANGAAEILSTDGTSTPAYGIAADMAGNVYFARGNTVYRVDLTTNSVTAVAAGLGNPHGIALDVTAQTLYVADHGTPPTPNGRILKLMVP